jgi:glycosyltransferase involved in cell wall biosynthesis
MNKADIKRRIKKVFPFAAKGDLKRKISKVDKKIEVAGKTFGKKISKVDKKIETERKTFNKKISDVDTKIASSNRNISQIRQRTTTAVNQIRSLEQARARKDKLECEVELHADVLGVQKNRIVDDRELVVSLTSFPERMYEIHLTIHTLLTQECKPNRVVLYLAREQFPNEENDIPHKVRDMKKRGLEIRWVDKDIRSFKKIIPALKDFPDAIIATADDDLLYRPFWLKELVDNYDGESVVCHLAHKIGLTRFNDGSIMPIYDSAGGCYVVPVDDEPSYAYFVQNGGGALYPPHIFSEAVFDDDVFMDLSKNSDCSWLYIQQLLCGIKAKIVRATPNKGDFFDLPTRSFINSNYARAMGLLDEMTLWNNHNRGDTGWDSLLPNLLKLYPKAFETLYTEYKPTLSLVILKNESIDPDDLRVKSTFDSILHQTLYDLEIIDTSGLFVSMIAEQNSTSIDSEVAPSIPSWALPNIKLAESKRAAIEMAAGEFIGFIKVGDTADKNFYEALYNAAVKHAGDIAIGRVRNHFGNQVTYDFNVVAINECTSKTELLKKENSSSNICEGIYRPKVLLEGKVDFSNYRTIPVSSDTCYHAHYHSLPELLVRDKLLITNGYPRENRLYSNMFVHQRVLEYKNRGFDIDVLVATRQNYLHTWMFEGVRVVEVPVNLISKFIGKAVKSRELTVLVHFMTPHLWGELKPNLKNIRLINWVHGYEIQNWYRRIFNYKTYKELQTYKEISKAQNRMWEEVFAAQEQSDIDFVFVSEYAAKEALFDQGKTSEEVPHKIIHNPIDTNTFVYEKKTAEQRYNFLSVRPFSSNKYANDLTVRLILLLSKHKDFSKMRFTIAGQGELFESITAPLEGFENVRLLNSYFSHEDIVKLHKDSGVFIVPTRTDYQGVSRDEAMSSGLVPLTNSVACIPEFVEDGVDGFAVPRDDVGALASAALKLIDSPELFLRMSEAAAARIRHQSAGAVVAKKEIELIWGDGVINEIDEKTKYFINTGVML